MAYLSNLIVAGNSKFLNKIYAGDLEVSGTFGTTGNVSVGGSLNVTGASTCTGGITISGESTFNNKVNFKGNGVELYHTSPYMDFHFNNSTTDYTSRIIEESSGIITIKPNLVVGSSATIPTATITTGTISNATIGNGIVTNLNVMDTLRATHYDLQTVAQLGGAFYVSPTVKFPTASNANIVVTKSGSTLTMVITDTSTITSTTMAGVVWQANAKIKASGKIGTVTTGTMDGTVTAVNVNSHSMTISVSGGNADAVQAGTYNKADIDNFCVMMYHTGSNPVGIMMNSYGTNGLTYIDIYGGSATSTYTTPNVRIGNLGGLTFNGSTLSNQWGIYTNNGYFSGKIIANGGTIGGFTIGDTAIYTGTLTSATDNYIGLSTADFTRSIGGTSRTGLRMAIGDKFGVTGDGIVYSSNLQATGGNIGGWIINPTTLSKSSTQKQTEGYIQYGAILQAPTESTIESTASSVAFGVRRRTYTNGAYTSWTYPFLVRYDGGLTATNADISGKITATSGSISGSLVTSGINADNITAGTISIERLTSIEVGGRNLIPYSKNLKSFTNESSARVTVTYTEDSCTIKNTYGSGKYGIFYDIEVESNATYTLSFYVSDISSIYTYYAIGNRTPGQTASWNSIREYQRIVEGKTICTFIVPETVTLVRIYFCVGILNGTCTIKNVKLEKGNKPTDWSPAPEDIDADITDASKVATNYIYYDTTNGLIISDSASSQTYTGASQGYNTQLTNNALNIRKNTTILASYGDEITFRKDGNIIASYGDEIILGNKTPTTDVPNPIYMKITSNSMELYKQVSSSSFSNLFSVGYGDAVHRRNETSSEHGMYLTLNKNNHLVSSEYITAFDMTASTSGILVQLRAIIKDTDSSTSDESTDIIEIKPTAENSTAYTAYDNEYKGVLGSNDFTVDYSLDKITINETNKVMTFITNYGTQYNIYIWVSYFATNTNDIYHFDLGKRNSDTSFGNYSFITGLNNTASNTFSVSMGQNNKNAGYRAIVNGYSNEITQNASCASVFGEGLKTVRQGSMVIGRYNAYDNGLFVVGNGTDNNNRQDAFVIRDRGKVYIYGNYAALTVTPNNTDSDKKNGGILSLQPSLNHNTLKGYTLKNDAGRLAIYSTPARDTTLEENKDYGMSLYIKSYHVIPSSSVHTGAQYKGTLSGQYDIMTSGYAMTSLTANSTYIDTSYSENLNKMYRKNGVVAIELEFRAKAAATAWATIYTVPIGFRPFVTHRNTVQGVTFQVTSSGNVQISTALVKNTIYHLHIVYPCVVPDVTES